MSNAEQENPEERLHVKRLGREMGMQYLFRCDMTSSTPSMEDWRFFFEMIREEHGLRDNRYARKGREYAELLFTGVAVHRDEIDAIIRERSENWDFDRLAIVDRNIMRLAVYEMLFVPSVPPVVSINEAVEIARDYSGEKAGSFINGVLNGIKDRLKRPDREVVQRP